MIFTMNSRDGGLPHRKSPFTEKNPPSFYEDWFLKDHVYKLEVGGYLLTDFQVITRIE